MRQLSEWDEVDLISLITNQVQESLNLDYKRSDALTKTSQCQTELAKDVSAFANSAGGRIVYGIVEADNLPVRIDEGSDPNIITREWIENTLISKIQPRIVGLIIKPIPLAAGGNAFVIDIPAATTFAPHQAGHRYYRRYNFQSVAMEDYEVKDALRRGTVGDPFIRFSWTPAENASDSTTQATLKAVIGNYANEPIMYARVRLFIDSAIVPDDFVTAGWEMLRGFISYGDDIAPARPISIFTRNITPGSHMPIFKEATWRVFELKVNTPPERSYEFGYDIACPGVSKYVVGSFDIAGFSVTPTSAETPNLFDNGIPGGTILNSV